MHAFTDRTSFNRHFGYTVSAPGPVRTTYAHAWQQPAPAAPAHPATDPFSGLGLTEREHDVAKLAVAGFSYAQIARSLFVAQTTVGYHLSNIYAKCGVRSRHELTELARRDAVLV
ncbi:MAG TPA: hypothetical protein DEQ43_16400 [Nocardioides bacterium]|uniref:response regulator transcription factor n=1 Tax=uncultured Nocardioides sp. TaxID=198441 RepID=UPI000EC3B543|nr:helix-turn-helix transcriptional regulator [uncultured Nocardioides sp.]HCB05799.1 hypothetical protein [Nocardioides sp.]